jgi:hypothetical protein
MHFALVELVLSVPVLALVEGISDFTISFYVNKPDKGMNCVVI